MLKKSDKGTSDVYWCIVLGSDLWVVDGTLPLGSASELGLPYEKAVNIGTYQGIPVMWLNDADVDCRYPLTSLRELLLLPEALFLLASKAVQYGYMTQTMRFCAQCGGRNHLNHNQLAMQCGDCRTLHYPRIFPCIIVGVRNSKQILLAQHPRHRNGMYTVIAGFLEVGETLEQCVAREVKEETGIDVKNIQYFGSQPWAFPSSMMMAYIAEYESGELKPDYSELTDAQWFLPSEMPAVAPEGTIARALIEHTLDLLHEPTT
ncbi:NAD(+) diphosphatase [Vibrio cortegadensis]|uniref:NAD(+) diphosphatase n=1 Tax=Vibrio cortegadensis TaxID=1328770 RepID=UPI0021C36A74|nr:NAD(+) diphosphatase [Vibrio cortegadensis]MDN3696445.1 NAD(+) diphosphatase [Vibrio cortegadensis]